MSLNSLMKGKQQVIPDGPGLPSPAGIVPNLDNPPNGNALCLGIITILLILATSAFILAVYVKFAYVETLYIEDFLGFSGFVLYIAQVYCSLSMIVHFGLFVHQWNFRFKNVAKIYHLVHLESGLYAASLTLLKTAILLKWVRIFVPRGTRGTFFWACYILLWTNILFYIILLAFVDFSGKPRTQNNKDKALLIASAWYNLASDVLIVLLPQRIIWRLHLETKKKFGIAAIFAIGISAITAAAYRLYASIEFSKRADETYGIANIVLGSQAEVLCAILVFYVPTFPKAFKDARKRFRSLVLILSRSKNTTGESSVRLSLNASGQVDAGIAHPRRTYIPQISVLHTTQVGIERAPDDVPMPWNFEESRHD
ncbi:hypothetical protein E0Z10_g8836 [Xylaria hypoxylon]|uniref:Rhodopsin domain-containing protein n=1 Tax=Xylaria hypoxylon TaxID=37992 RepID=A0A4Z0YIR3_9PEZI|nr:hypothetical protein E0Z10_g8836 [Xylaria hypoxylon]